jgi:hypothetical protein
MERLDKAFWFDPLGRRSQRLRSAVLPTVTGLNDWATPSAEQRRTGPVHAAANGVSVARLCVWQWPLRTTEPPR